MPWPLGQNASKQCWQNSHECHICNNILHISRYKLLVLKWRLKENYKDHLQTIFYLKLFKNWAWTESNWAIGLKNLSFKIKPSMCQESHVTCIIFYSIFSHCWVLLLVYIYRKRKKEWYPLVIHNSDFALLNHRQIMLPKNLEQIAQ